MTTPANSTDYCAVRRARVDRVVSGLGALALIGAARRFDGWASLGLAAFGGLILGRAMTGYRVGKADIDASIAMPRTDAVQQAGEDSFPASDPPSWSPTSVGAAHPTPA